MDFQALPAVTQQHHGGAAAEQNRHHVAGVGEPERRAIQQQVAHGAAAGGGDQRNHQHAEQVQAFAPGREHGRHREHRGAEILQRLRQRHFQLFKLLIDVNPNSLKGAGRRVLARLARANRATHDLGKLPGGAERLASPCLNNLCCNCLSKPFFPMVRDHLPDFFFVGAVEPLGRGLAARGVHAHVERAFLHEREAALGAVELRAGHSQVEQDPGNGLDPAFGQRRAHRREPAVDQLKTRILERAIRMRLGVLIKSEKSSANTETGEDGRAVPAATKGAIDVGSVFADVQGRHAFFE